MTGENSGRVTTKTFYEALLEQNAAAAQREQRIIDRINEGITAQLEYQTKVEARLAAGSVHFEKFEKDIDKLKDWDRGLGILSVLGSIIASAIGIDK